MHQGKIDVEDSYLDVIAEMEATIEQYRKEIQRLEKKRNTLLKMNRELKEELTDWIDIFLL